MIVKKLTISRLLNDVQQCTPQWGVQATERSCVSKMEGLRPDKFAFALATNIPVGCLSDRTFLRKQNGGVSLRQVPVDISHILGNLITVIFDYQILRKPLKILSL